MAVCLFALLTVFSTSLSAYAGAECEVYALDKTESLLGITTVVIFIIAYILVMAEEFLHLRKSKPVILASGIIWIIVAIIAKNEGPDAVAHIHGAINHNILEYAGLLLFLLVAMTYVNAMEERGVFEALRAWLVKKQYSYRALFWITGILAFFISPVADNLTTALLMCAVVMAVGADNPRFVSLSCINIVIAANAGGAFSPFGDITTLMVWQKGYLPFQSFFKIFIPSVVSYIIPAFIMSLAVPKATPKAIDEHISMLYGAKTIIFLFVMTIVTAVSFHNFLHLPPTVGMMTGLSYLFFYGFYLKKIKHRTIASSHSTETVPFDIFSKVQRAEWDTLLFFYGIVMCVGGLATIGYLDVASNIFYNQWGSGLSEMHQQTPANIIVGLLSAIIDNIPVMFAVLTMGPAMSEGQWLLVTLTAGIGGSLLSIGSAAGVALMGQSRGYYTFFGHMKWSWAIGLGYFAAVYAHVWLNKDLFKGVMTISGVGGITPHFL
tara:strand:+ start:139873 stop:141348 length:1476 start_codon:yes stop_codon:yes gene_type:complete